MILSPDLAARLSAASATFATTLTGLAFETIPFLLMGTLLSSLIRVFVPDRAIRRIFPRNRYLSILVALFVGALMPICECGTVPLARRLRRKGLPLSTAAAFLLAAPLADPMTIISTYVDFKGNGYPVFAFRLGFGLAAAFAVSLIVEPASRKIPGLDIAGSEGRFRRVAAAYPAPPRLGAWGEKPRAGLASKAAEVLEHASCDFLDTGRFLIAGISIAALARAFIPPSTRSSPSSSSDR